jgi:hypothetical protein
MMRISREALCLRIILADTPITAVSPGKVDAGVTKYTTDATAGGGMWEAPGIFTRNRWKGHPPMCPTSSSSTTPLVLIARRLRKVMPRRPRAIRRPVPTTRHLRPRPHRIRRRALSAARWLAACSADLSRTDRAAWWPARSRAERPVRSSAPRPRSVPDIIGRRADAIIDIRRDNTRRWIRAAAIETRRASVEIQSGCAGPLGLARASDLRATHALNDRRYFATCPTSHRPL